MIGEHTVTLTPIGGPAVDLSCWVDQVSITHGREDPSGQPEASTCTVDLSPNEDDEPVPAGVEIGGTVQVATTIGAGTFVRFTGRISDLNHSWEDVGAETPEELATQVIAVHPLGDLGRRIIGDTPFPAELDGARVARVLAAADITLDPAFSDPGTVQLLPRDIDTQPALTVAQASADSGSGLLWGTRTGEVRYADAQHRRNATPALSLDACDILVSPAWHRSTEALLNKVSVGYGVAVEGSEQPRYVAQRDDSIGRFGRYELSSETELAALADAEALGQLLLTRNSAPVWVMANLPVDMADLDQAQTVALLEADMHTLTELTGLPAAGGAPTSTALWVEGWTETLAWDLHEITLFVSGYCRTVPPPRWNDVDPASTWDTYGTGTWDEASCIGPQPSRGRWDDVAATLRWDQIPPATTWDTWT